MSTSPPLAILLVATAMALLLASSVIPAAAAAAAVASGGRYGGGRMVFVHGPRRTKQVGGARGNEWRHYLARVEDEVAPEFGGILATNSRGGSISSGALDKGRPICPSGSQCAARGGGGSYTRPCTYKNQCPH